MATKSGSPYTSDTKFRVPLNFNEKGKHPYSDSFHQIENAVRKLSNRHLTSAVSYILTRIDNCFSMLEDLNIKIGMLSSCLPPVWNDVAVN